MSADPRPAPVPGWPVAFRGSLAVRAGLVTKAQLRGPRYLRLFPDVYVRADAESPDLTLRSLAAYEYGRRRGVLSGYSAAELLEASCGPRDAPAELTVPSGRLLPHTGLELHRDSLLRSDVRSLHGVQLTTFRRTAYDLARWDVHDNQRRDWWGNPVVPSWYTESSPVLDLDGAVRPRVVREEPSEMGVTIGADGFTYTRYQDRT